MKKEEILATIKSLASSQGSYGRLYESICDNPVEGDKWLTYLENQNLKDIIDLIFFIES